MPLPRRVAVVAALLVFSGPGLAQSPGNHASKIARELAQPLQPKPDAGASQPPAQGNPAQPVPPPTHAGNKPPEPATEFFWTSLPGVLTALATLIGAISGLILAIKGRRKEA